MSASQPGATLRSAASAVAAALGRVARPLVIEQGPEGLAVREGGSPDEALDDSMNGVGKTNDGGRLRPVESNGHEPGPTPDGSANGSANGTAPEPARRPWPARLLRRAFVPALRPADLGDGRFLAERGLRLPYVAGAMANGIASVELVEAMGRAGLLGIFGAAGLVPKVVEAAIDRLSTRLAGRPWGCNLIHSPYEPALEEAVADLYVRRGVPLVSASAYMGLTLPLVRYRLAGIRRDDEGRVVTPHAVIGKVSRAEVAEKLLSPAPAEMIDALVRRGDLTDEQAQLAARVPVAGDLVVEADSGGHTDNRPALTLFPALSALAERMAQRFGYERLPRLGLGGGIATPHAAAAAFAMGAAFVLTGSVNQATLEAGTSDAVRQLLAGAGQADVTMAPAADMFEMGVELQVLSRGTAFPQRAQRLRQVYEQYPSLEAIPADERARLESQVFGQPLAAVWDATAAFWAERDADQLQRAEADGKHRMALTFRWYLGSSSRWANAGDPERTLDYQVWCGPAMGAFNDWVRGSFLEPWENRRAVPIALNIIWGAAVLTRARMARAQGVVLPDGLLDLAPREPAELEELFA